MLNITSKHEQVLILVIVDFGVGGKVLEEAKKVGVTGGTIFLGRGTIKHPILKALGLDEARKEIVLMISPSDLEALVHDHIVEKFHMDKRNHGIILTLPVKRVFGLHNFPNNDSQDGGNGMSYEVVCTVVERGLGQEVVDAATAAGSTGATIINARGSGIHERAKFFSMNIEPEKEIVMIIIDKDKVEKIINAIRETLHIDEPGKGIMFSLDVNRVAGLYKPDK